MVLLKIIRRLTAREHQALALLMQETSYIPRSVTFHILIRHYYFCSTMVSIVASDNLVMGMCAEVCHDYNSELVWLTKIEHRGFRNIRYVLVKSGCPSQ